MLRQSGHTSRPSATPVFFRLGQSTDKKAFEDLLASGEVAFLYDEIEGQLKELIKCLHPAQKLSAADYEQKIRQHLDGRPADEYGVWVYFPWNRKMVHLLDEAEFVTVRTNRNRYKITDAEQQALQTRIVGIVGLSVGQSIALTLAMERSCGELRLADFDTAELSNLNRIRTATYNLGLPKTIIAAREIAEIDPFLKVKIFSDGLTRDNIDTFFDDGKPLDLLVEVCDGLDIKIISRFKARSMGIPVVMDTNDRGMLDVERFDLEPDRPVLHGLAGDLNPEKIKDLSNEDKIPYILKMVGADTLSTRMKASMMEVEQSINTWPQLASSVVLGGAVTTDVVRRIFLDQYHQSGRYYIDLEALVGDGTATTGNTARDYAQEAPAPIDIATMEAAMSQLPPPGQAADIPGSTLQKIADAAIAAPSGGNAQPWKFYYRGGRIYIFHDRYYSYSLLDHKDLGSYVSIGAAIENISLQARAEGYDTEIQYFPLKDNRTLVAIADFSPAPQGSSRQEVAAFITRRLTNRTVSERVPLPPSAYEDLEAAISDYQGAKVHFITEPAAIQQLGEVLATAEMLRMLHPRGHYDTFVNELRWTPEENEAKRDGMDVATLGVSKAETLALKVAADPEAISFIRSVDGGKGMKKIARKAIAGASAIGIVTMPHHTGLDYLNTGRAVERLWIEANKAGIALQPFAQYIFLSERANDPEDRELGPEFRQALQQLQEHFRRLVPLPGGEQPMFIFRLAIAPDPEVRSLRRDKVAVFLTD